MVLTVDFARPFFLSALFMADDVTVLVSITTVVVTFVADFVVEDLLPVDELPDEFELVDALPDDDPPEVFELPDDVCTISYVLR